MSPIMIFLGIIGGIGIVAMIVLIEMVAVDIIDGIKAHMEAKKENKINPIK